MPAQSVTFAYNKQKIAEFAANYLEFAQQDGGLLLIAEGEMIFQDTPLVEALMNERATCHVTLVKDGEIVVEQNFDVTFFTFEHTELTALLQ